MKLLKPARIYWLSKEESPVGEWNRMHDIRAYLTGKYRGTAIMFSQTHGTLRLLWEGMQP